ncbi:hypothetical protein [Bacillus pseudomycoides]|nr:hypothetical protein [Bacillus pseudomycoides]EEM01827.1 hypothetical protein bmyco0002_58400 [Bacillus pseudomycoides]MCR8860614.1 hypothetical protein [Bacillus pseudomycoides]
MYSLGLKELSIIVKVLSQTKAEKVATVCEEYNFLLHSPRVYRI